MLIDSDELIQYFESACNICKDKGTKYCDRYCFVGDVVDMIKSFIEYKTVNSAK